MANKKRVPAIQGWFTQNESEPHLLGTRCTSCGSYFFPKAELYCGNPHCQGTEFEEVELSRTGTVWSFSEHFYQPPEPYMSPEPFVPYSIAAVELTEEKMVVLGQVAAGVDSADLKAGMNVELVLEPLYEDDDAEYLVWKWKPLAA